MKSRETVGTPELFGFTSLPRAETVILVSRLCPRMNVLLVRFMAEGRGESGIGLVLAGFVPVRDHGGLGES